MRILFHCLLALMWLTGVSRAQTSHYTQCRMRIDFNGEIKKIAISSHLIICGDINADQYRTPSISVPHRGSVEDALIVVKAKKAKAKEFGKKDALLAADRVGYALVSDARAYTWDLGKLEPGTEIDYEYEIKDSDALGGDFCLAMDRLPVDTTTITIKFPSDKWRLKYSVDNGKPALIDSSDKAVFTWYNLPGKENSKFKGAPPDLSPGIWYLFESKTARRDISDWQDVYQWVEERFGDDISFSEPAKMLEIAAGPEQILSAIHKQCRYVAIELGEGWHVPTPPDEVWKRGYGDCKGLAALFVSWMRAAGFDSWPVLVLASDSISGNTDFPSPFMFNHMIAAYLDPPNDTVYQDLTAGFCPAGYLPTSLYHSLAFPIKPNSIPFRLGSEPREPDTVAIEIAGRITSDGIMVGSVGVLMRGRNALLENWHGSQSRNIDKEQTARSLLESLMPKASFREIKHDSVSQDEMSLRSNITIRRFCFQQDSIAIFRPWIFSFIREDVEPDTARFWPVTMKRNTFYKVAYRIKLDDPMNLENKATTSGQSFEEFTYGVAGTSKDDSLIFELSLHLPPLSLPPDSFANYINERKSMLRDLESASMYKVIRKPSE